MPLPEMGMTGEEAGLYVWDGRVAKVWTYEVSIRDPSGDVELIAEHITLEV